MSTATLSLEVWPCASGGGPDLWYSYTTMSTLNIRVETCGSAYDTALEILTGACGALTSVACNDDACSTQSLIELSNQVPGTTYLIRVGCWQGAVGTGTLTISEVTPPPTPPVSCAESNFLSNNGGAIGGAVFFDMTMVPTPMGQVAAMAGETWYLQAIYRDATTGGPTFNFTNALGLTLQ